MLVVAMALELQIPPMYLVLLSFGFGAYVSFLPWKESTCSSPDVVHSYFYWEFINIVLCCCMGDILWSVFGVLNGLLLKFSFYNCFCPFFMGSTSTCSLISCPNLPYLPYPCSYLPYLCYLVAGNFWSLSLLHYGIFSFSPELRQWGSRWSFCLYLGLYFPLAFWHLWGLSFEL